MEAVFEDEGPTQEEHHGMDQSPDPAHRRPDETLFEIAAHELEKQAPPLDQIAQKQRSWNSAGHCQN